MGVHDVEEVRESHLSPLVPHVGLKLGDGGRHAQAPHYHCQLVHGADLARPRVQVETLAEFIDVLLSEESSLGKGKVAVMAHHVVLVVSLS